MKTKTTQIICGNRFLLFALTVIIIILQLAACSPHRQIMKNDFSNANDTISRGKQDGLSYNTAVIIKEKSESLGVKAEYAWIKEHYPNYRVKKQALVEQNKRPYDIIIITLSNETDVDLYFDISNFYGSW